MTTRTQRLVTSTSALVYVLSRYVKFEDITFYNLSAYHYNLHYIQNCIITGYDFQLQHRGRDNVMKRLIFELILFMVLPSLCFAQSANTQEDLRCNYRKDLPFYSISEINQANLPQGQYNTEGYVLLISTCPPCPEGAHCETCLIDHLLISQTDQFSNLTGSRIRKNDLILFADDLTQFKLGRRYSFSIKIPGSYSFDAKYMTSYSNRFQIVGYRLFNHE